MDKSSTQGPLINEKAVEKVATTLTMLTRDAEERGKYEKQSSSQTFDWELGMKWCFFAPGGASRARRIVSRSEAAERRSTSRVRRNVLSAHYPDWRHKGHAGLSAGNVWTCGTVDPVRFFMCEGDMWYFSHQGSCARSASIYRTVLWLLMNSTRFSSAKLCYLIRYGRAVVTHALICGPPPSFVFLQIPNRRGSRNTSQRYKFGPCRLVPIPVFVFERCPINIEQIQGDNVHDIWMSGGFWGIRL